MSRRKFKSEFKFKVVLEALSDRYSIQEIARKYELHATQITTWKRQFLNHGQSVFDQPVKDTKSEAEEKEERLLRTIGQLKVENDFLKKASL
jgi:transposase